jgi:Mg/Co/Ni transporter MgtE
VPLEALLTADPRSLLGELADGAFASVSAETDRELAAALAARRGTRRSPSSTRTIDSRGSSLRSG